MDLNKQKTIVIFSHGMGVRKDNRGLFTELAEAFGDRGIKSIPFNYDKFDPKTKEIFVGSFSDNSQTLQLIINKTFKEYPNSKIVIVAHSQGGITAALCDLKKVSQLIAVSPFFHTKMSDVLRRYSKNPQNQINLTGTTRRKRSDGTTTIIKAKYWKERFEIDPINKFNNAAVQTLLTLICPLQDEIMDYTDLKEIKRARIINIDGDHDFSKQYRKMLIEIIIRELVA